MSKKTIMIPILRLVFSAALALLAIVIFELAAQGNLDTFTFNAAQFWTLLALFAITCLVNPLFDDISFASGPREEGKVKWFNVSKGYGFVTRENGEDVFVHFRSIRGKGRRILYEGQTVSFRVSTGDKGPQADDVEPLTEK
ncbi:MAG: CspA family cold shock protein [Pseudohongiellaceae bacterium]|jgi:CspA family cold shock protein